jgi:hypothetical protein
MAITKKRLLISESRGDSNQCTSYRGKPDQHDTYASHASPRTSGVRFLRAVPVRGKLSYSRQQIWTDPLHPRRRAPDTIHSTPAVRSADLYPTSLSQQSMEQWGKSQASVDNRLLGLPGPYHQYAIGTFNTCSRVPTPRSLTDTGEGYHIENLRIATTLSPSFPSEGSTDPPKWPRPVSNFYPH